MITLKDIKADLTSDLKIKGVTYDSREVEPGYIFVAIQGKEYCGEDFAVEAMKKGACAIVTSKDSDLELEIPLIKSENPRKYLSFISSLYYSKSPEIICAITGTNGKTSTINFLHQIWNLMNLKAASIGTLGVIKNKQIQDTNITTPDPVLLHKTLQELYYEDVSHVAIEASSHGLSQHRVDSVNIKAAGFTNISQDHLDYHKNMQEYFNSKKRLFTEILSNDGCSVVCVDTSEGKELSKIINKSGRDVMEIGKYANSLNLKKLISTDKGIKMNFHYDGEEFFIPIKVEGYFQATNILCAAGLAIASGSPSDKVFTTLKDLLPIMGRFEFCGYNKLNAKIYVDYAHTPDALASALISLRNLTKGKIILIFGCGGSRDKYKRPIMGEIAKKFADIIIITDDNPRNEDPKKIRKDIIKSCLSFTEIPDREEAISKAISIAKDGDSILIAGKGHEKFQIIENKKFPFSDQKIVKDIIGS